MSDSNATIMFSVTKRAKADFKIQLQYDSLTQVKFFRAIMEGYSNKDTDLIAYLNRFKEQNSIQNATQRKRTETNTKKAKQTKKQFALGDEEVDNIFDILEKEHPDL